MSHQRVMVTTAGQQYWLTVHVVKHAGWCAQLAVAVQSLLCLRHTYSGRPTTAAAAAAAAAAAPGVDVNISVGGDCDAQRLLWYKRRVVSSSYTSAGLTGRERNSAYHSRALS